MPVYERSQIQCTLLKADKRLFADWCVKCCVALSPLLWVPIPQNLRLPLETATSKAACILLHFTNQTGTHLAYHRFSSKGFCHWGNAKQKIGVQQVIFPTGAVLSHQILNGISGITSSLTAFILPNKFKDAFSFTTYCSGLFCLCILLSWTHLRAALYHG